MTRIGDIDLAKTAQGWLGLARSNRLFAPALGAAALVAVIDQASKAWIVNGIKLPERVGGRIELSPIFDLTFVKNFGASFGMLSGGMASRIFLSLLSLSVAAALIYWLAKVDRKLVAAGIAFIVGGAVGNLIDRVSLGYVVDFLDFSGLYFPWVFNVADTAINVGVACLLLDAWLTREKKTPDNPA